MKSMGIGVMATLVLLSVWSAAAFAQSEPQAQPPAADTSQAPGGDPRRAELRYLEALRRAVIEELKLPDDKLRAVMEHFKEHTQFVEQYQPGQAPSKEAALKERAEQRRKLREAKQDRDDKTARELSDQMKGSRPDDSLRKATKEFHGKVSAELNDEQKAKFKELVQRLYRPKDRLRANGADFRPMRQAMDGFNLSQEKHKAINDHLAKAMKAFGETGEDRNAARKIQEQLQADILSELDPEQQKTFLANLEKARQEPPMPPRAKRKPELPKDPPPPVPDQSVPAAEPRK